MAAYIVYFLISSVVAIPYLAFLLLRTRRDLSELRDELRARGVIAPGRGRRRGALAALRDDARPLGSGGPAGSGDLRASVEALAVEVERIAERQRALTAARGERAGAAASPGHDEGTAPAEAPRA